MDILKTIWVFLGRIFFPYWWFVGGLTVFYAVKNLLGFKPKSVVASVFVKGAYLIHREALEGSPGSPKKYTEWLYAVLTTLDAKASALMRLSGVMLAAATFILGSGSALFVEASFLTGVIKPLTLTIAILSAVSIGLCMLVVSIDWPFLGLVDSTAGQPLTDQHFARELAHLQRVTGFRQFVYRFAWLVSSAATTIFIGILIYLLRKMCGY